jgi:hypothetical protein
VSTPWHSEARFLSVFTLPTELLLAVVAAAVSSTP